MTKQVRSLVALRSSPPNTVQLRKSTGSAPQAFQAVGAMKGEAISTRWFNTRICTRPRVTDALGRRGRAFAGSRKYHRRIGGEDRVFAERIELGRRA
jgi:hypothetical protein